MPHDFNISIVCPIPKAKVVQSSPGDFRPISLSSCFAIVLEAIILNRTACTLKRTHNNQFGYRANTSCKHAFFVLNETIRYYNRGGASVYVASLDAEKAFDSLWRDGLFYKLIGIVSDYAWRTLVNYYSQSRACVRLDGQLSDTFHISGGVKQGGILSPFLFNFFIDDLIDDLMHSSECGLQAGQDQCQRARLLRRHLPCQRKSRATRAATQALRGIQHQMENAIQRIQVDTHALRTQARTSKAPPCSNVVWQGAHIRPRLHVSRPTRWRRRICQRIR